ncbi:DUF2264 domain-containing protein [Oribacterium sp. WCC10]|uniref:DUF2264 domain-containing protein n=1 Tax=Oribacterium sp. WCC10 TaxID=1855343 RepID=UPI001586FB5E|nr:DUF2264 domain-containing protein [Oribacterium sp. WCC10]
MNKREAQNILLKMLEPLIPFYSEKCARLRIGDTRTHYELSSQEMEAFARPLWGLVPLVAGLREEEKQEVKRLIHLISHNKSDESSLGFDCSELDKTTNSYSCHDVPGSGLTQIAQLIFIYQKGITSGTEPESPEYWGICHDFDQKFCEMPAIGFAMLYAPEFFFDPLPENVKLNLTEWLNECNRHNLCACNWQFFQIITNLALKVSGLTYSQENMESGLRMIEDYYAGGGWYNDGNGGDKDYYNPFVMLSFGLIYRDFMKDEDPERCQRFYDRAMKFGKDYRYFFDDNGACFPYGRSMTYRFAQSAFWATCLQTNVEPIPKEEMLSLISKNLHWWLNRPVFDNAGILSIGYGYPNLQMSESYNAPGSPYWGLQAFFYLSLKDEDELWNVTKTPGDLSDSKDIADSLFLPHVPLLLQRGYKDGVCNHVVALVPGKTNHEGHSHNVEKYSKFAYSSRFGFSIARSNMNLQENAPDSTLAFVIDGFVYTKNMTEPDYVIDKEHIEMRWSPVRGINVTTVLIPTETGHTREHIVDVDKTLYDGVLIKACDCGFAIPDKSCFKEESLPHHFIDDKTMKNVESQETSAPSVVIPSYDDLFCTVHSLEGNGREDLLVPEPNTSLIYPKTTIPMCVYDITAGTSHLKTEFIYL